MEDYQSLYEDIKKEYERYKTTTNREIKNLTERNENLKSDISYLWNILNVSKYINQNFSSKNLIPKINDMIIGILGVKFSSIFLIEDGKLKIKYSNVKNMDLNLTENQIKALESGRAFLKNSKSPFKIMGKDGLGICSSLGVPIVFDCKLIGYIIVEHQVYKFITERAKNFLQSIANQISVPIHNSFSYKKLEELTQMDCLLDIFNRKHFFNLLKEMIDDEDSNKFALVMIDIDDFKKLNDLYGHQFGDTVLIESTKLVKQNLSTDDLIGRYGGEEFILYMPFNGDKLELFKKIEFLRRGIEKNIISFNSKRTSITASFGVAFFPEDATDIDKLIKVADEYLYTAKKNGKNKIVCKEKF